jgi:hypothetical protein
MRGILRTFETAKNVFEGEEVRHSRLLVKDPGANVLVPPTSVCE